MLRPALFQWFRSPKGILLGALLVLALCPEVVWAQRGGGGGGFGGGGGGDFEGDLGAALGARGGRRIRVPLTPEEEARVQELSNSAGELLRNAAPDAASKREALLVEIRKIQNEARLRWETDVPNYKTFAIDQSSSSDAKAFIENIIGNPDGRIRMLQLDNSFLVSGASDQQLAAIQKFLEVVRPPTGDLRIFKLQHASAEGLVVSVAQSVPNVNIAVDQRTNSLIVSANDPSSMEKVLALVRELDQLAVTLDKADSATPGNYKLELVWLTETTNLNPAQTAALRTPDRRLDAAVQELKAAGFRDVMQGGQVRLVTLPDMGFRARSFETLGELAVEGMITISENGKANLHLGGLRVKEADKPGIDVSTSVNLTPGEHLILGIAGTNPENASRRSAFVIRVEK